MNPPQHRAKTGIRVAVPLHFALLLCLAAFLAGRWLPRSTHNLPADDAQQVQESWVQQCLQHSGLLQQRPPLQPAKSGNTHYTLAPYQVLSWYPRIVVFPNFIDDARSSAIMQLAQGRLQPSTVRVREQVGEHSERASGRSSSGTFLAEDEDTTGALAWLERKIQDVTLLPASHGEKFYVIKYQPGEKYDPHLDPHDESEYGPQKTKRIATVLVYLSDVGSGGETLFPREGKDGSKRPVGIAQCSLGQGLSYKPRRGDAVLFYSTSPDLTLDVRSMHAGCPVGRGSEKWVVTKWLHDKPIVAEGGFGW